MPSKYPEPFGLVAAEAICSGIPVIVNDSAFLAEEIQSLDLGLVYNSGFIDDLTRKIEEFMSMDESTLLDMGNRCKRIGKEIFNNEEVWISQLLKLYRLSISSGIDAQLELNTVREL